MSERKATRRTTAEQTTETVYAGDDGDTMGNPPMSGTGEHLSDQQADDIRNARQEEGARQDAEQARSRDDE